MGGGTGDTHDFNPVGRFGVGLGWRREYGPLGEVLVIELRDRGRHGPLGQAGEHILVLLLVLPILVVLTELSP